MTFPNRLPEAAEVYRSLALYKKALADYETVEFMRMASEWNRIEKELSAAIEALVFEIETFRLAGKPIGMSDIRKLETLRSLVVQAQERVTTFYKQSEDAIREGQAWHLTKGLEKGIDDIRESYAMVSRYSIRFDMLPYRAIENMIGFAGDGSPLNTLLKTSYGENAEAIGQVLVSGLASGINPRETAVKISDLMRGHLDRALTVARTEQIRAFRTANVMQYQESGVVETYTRHCAFNTESCIACIVLDGTVYPVTQQFGDHPNGRCFATANVKGVNPPKTLTGKGWLLKQTDATQQKIMGVGHFDAWKSGKLQLEDLASVSHDDTWGEQIRITPLKSLIGGDQ